MSTQKVNPNTASFKAGAGKERITPPIGVPIIGHIIPDRIYEGANDDLWAKALVLEKGAERVAIIAMDLCWPMPENDYTKIRNAVEKATGIKAENIMVSCTHNHQGPLFNPNPTYNLSVKKQKELIDPWVEALPERVADAVKQAAENTREAEVSFGKTPITGICYNRKKRIPDGVANMINVGGEKRFYYGDTPEMPYCIRQQYVDWGMSVEEADVYAPVCIPDGEIDPDLDVVHFKNMNGKTIGVLSNFACHAVSCSPPVPKNISAGFPGFMTSLVEEATGGICLFTYGAGGDIRPYRSSGRGFEEAQRIGFVLATGIMQAIREAEPVAEPNLRVEREIIEVGLREWPSREESLRVMEEKKKLLEKTRAQGKFLESKKLYEEIDQLHIPLLLGRQTGYTQWIDQKGNASLELQAISIGDVILLSMPNEVNVSLGLEIKNASWTKKLILATLANGCWMYLLKKEEYDEGSYELAACRLVRGSGEQVVDTSLSLIERMKKS